MKFGLMYEIQIPEPHYDGIEQEGIVNLLSDLCSSHSVCNTRRMNTPPTHRYKHHRFPAEIISHAVWLYFRFSLSYRDGIVKLTAQRKNTFHSAGIPSGSEALTSHLGQENGLELTLTSHSTTLFWTF